MQSLTSSLWSYLPRPRDTPCQWIPTSGTLQFPSLRNAQPCPTGREKTGSPLFVVRAHHNDGVHPGKAGPHIPGAFISWAGKEILLIRYEVLVLADDPQDVVHWVSTSGTLNLANLTARPIEAGEERDGSLFIARAHYKDGIHLGKAAPHLLDGAFIPWGGEEVIINQYEVLCYV